MTIKLGADRENRHDYYRATGHRGSCPFPRRHSEPDTRHGATPSPPSVIATPRPYLSRHTRCDA
ncbi:hypothetical protein I551_6574 [Mycobacterium ulcerans str. Harvey]|uniref:Uncharacterized protein n=1 Tax=Mycobacterium ulcerans str. Harvey TaxID=1299332 RepID=A0ABN0QQJ0_MYCUL|nr:hypothetical protein I551_6574 [Mycobacterium ulcerans str. Harvey]